MEDDHSHLSRKLEEGLYCMGFYQPSKIQEDALPLLLSEPPQDMVAQSQSGTGKTVTFLLAMLHRVDATKACPQCLVLAPSLELAQQIGEVAAKMTMFMPGVKVRCATKGERVARGVAITEQVLVGTPGKILDWMTRYQAFDPKHIVCFVLDEADQIVLNEGTHNEKCIQIHKLVQANKNCQIMLFSATFSSKVFQLVENLVETDAPLHPTVLRSLPRNNSNSKYKTIRSLYSSLTIASSIIFCHTKVNATWLADKMRTIGRDVAILHGDMRVVDRERVAQEFKSGLHKVLITTNLCSRGLDMPQLSLVVNYDPPIVHGLSPMQPDYDTYLHRIGRTGRFGKPGLAINLVDGDNVMRIVKAFGQYFGRPISELDANDQDQLDAIEANTNSFL